MYIHLGRDVLVRAADVVGIFDLENTTTLKETRQFLKRAEQESRVTNVSSDLPKSFVVTVERGVERVYISQIAAATLGKRAFPKKPAI